VPCVPGMDRVLPKMLERFSPWPNHISPYSRRNYDINLLARKQRILENVKLLLRNQNHLGTPEKGQIVAEEAIQISQSETADKPSR
jgi:hypothetical protein